MMVTHDQISSSQDPSVATKDSLKYLDKQPVINVPFYFALPGAVNF
ncbi:protein of unknown function [Magnetospirillum sp. XM-1]|nr:protein of unknown function [Magnetospirillum sp. XM-1]